MDVISPQINPAVTSITIPAEAAHTANTRAPPYPPSEMSPTPPPIPVPPFQFEASPTPPASPTLRRPPQSTTQVHGADNTNDSLMESAPPTPTEEAPFPQVRNPGATAQRLRPLTLSRSEGDIPTGPTLNPMSSICARLAAAKKPAHSYVSTRGRPRNPLDKYTNATMPAVHLADPTAAFNDIDLDTVIEWDNSPGKLLAFPFEKDADQLANHKTIKGLILAAAIEITGSQCVAVGAPRQTEEARIQKRFPPNTFLTYHLTEDQRQLLLKRGVWSSASITFRVTPFDPISPDFLFAIQELDTLFTNDIYTLVRNTWRDADTMHKLNAIISETPEVDRHDTEVALKSFIDSMWVEKLDVKAAGALPKPSFNVFAKGSFIKQDQLWTTLHDHLASRSYSSIMLDTGRTLTTPYDCHICHCITHPRGLCPFPSIEGWNGPNCRPANPTRERGGKMTGGYPKREGRT
ncbi:hypothetical protein BGW80DRAFT_1452838 [Lactifluus volemus]|nr:hypothetical protein BGW80DRAFT_1452838 [Lactifluus volemus]